ncbi:hypothetical protein [Lutibaculum baratangense]|uniref:Uncharacterized protein n=1 Tax=Lutibaculum baratangense AMV1 TaxID=631454 RepID=V4RL87_9HYPH|nr:hypothetical protein [Lutibaculum baratangense]ESR23985.1 hypothetical protein N177_2754 [Lutibaculum baratangense AMV1]
MAFMLAVTSSFGWIPSGHVSGMDATAAADNVHLAEPAGHADTAVDSCCTGLVHAADGYHCSFHCAPAVWGTSTLRRMNPSAITALADIGADGAVPLTPFRPPVV